MADDLIFTLNVLFAVAACVVAGVTVAVELTVKVCITVTVLAVVVSAVVGEFNGDGKRRRAERAVLKRQAVLGRRNHGVLGATAMGDM